MKQIILIGHNKRFGKDTLADMMVRMTDGKIVRFADPLKHVIADTFNISVGALEDRKNEEQILLHSDSTPQTYRDVLQRFGNEAMKKQFGDSVWVDAAVIAVNEALEKYDTVIIPDFRFLVEYNALHYVLGDTTNITTVNILRPGAENKDAHASEIELNTFNYDHTIVNAGTLMDLADKAAELLRRLNEVQ